MRRPKSACSSCPKCSGEYSSALTPPPQLKLTPRSNKDDHGSRCNRRCVVFTRITVARVQSLHHHGAAGAAIKHNRVMLEPGTTSTNPITTTTCASIHDDMQRATIGQP